MALLFEDYCLLVGDARSFLESYKRFGGTSLPDILRENEGIRFFLKQTTRRHMPGNSNLHIHNRGNIRERERIFHIPTNTEFQSLRSRSEWQYW
jgi:hypothetical protein